MMINAIIIGSNAVVEGVLKQQADITTTVIHSSSLDDVVEQVRQYHPDIFILKHEAGELNGDILCHFLSRHYPVAQSLILVEHEPTFGMLKNSGFKARGYISKEQLIEIDKAVRAVYSGEAWLPRKLVSEMLDRFEMYNENTN